RPVALLHAGVEVEGHHRTDALGTFGTEEVGRGAQPQAVAALVGEYAEDGEDAVLGRIADPRLGPGRAGHGPVHVAFDAAYIDTAIAGGGEALGEHLGVHDADVGKSPSRGAGTGRKTGNQQD